jgi:hypothetical protein
MRFFIDTKPDATIRKIKTLGLSVFFNMWLQISGLVYSAATVLALSKDFWGSYSKLIITISFFMVICGWGSREYLTTNRNTDFSAAVAQNVFRRMGLFAISAVTIYFTLPNFALFSIILLFFKFINAGFEIIASKERKFGWMILFELLFLSLFVCVIFTYSEPIQNNFNYFLFIFIAIECLRSLAYLFTQKVKFKNITLKSIFIELKSSFYFFINSLFGYYASRIDGLLTIFFFNTTQIATYQIAFNFVFLFQGLSNFIFYTYSFHFFRLTISAKNRVIKKYFLIGFVTTLLFLTLTPFLFKYLYNIELGFVLHLLLSLIVLLSFIHQPYIYLIYQSKKTIQISLVSFVSILIFTLVLLVFNTILINASVFSNFIYASFMAQLFRTLIFIVIGRRSLVGRQNTT